MNWLDLLDLFNWIDRAEWLASAQRKFKEIAKDQHGYSSRRSRRSAKRN